MAKQPEKIDKYNDVSLLARGGMGAVYKATHPTLNRPVILKKLTLRGKSSFAERFRREARILMDFHHDDIVTVFDHFKQGSSYYIVMEYVEGASLEDLLRKYRYLESVLCAYILLHSAKALGYAHQRGVVHRDIKPANILLSRDGAIKLADFGIAASAEDAETGLTSEGMTLGTPSYMAPEQFENSKYVDARADIYALGVMTYEMSTGKRPFSGGFSPELISAKQKGRYKKPGSHIPGIAKPLLRTIRGSMRTSRKRRYSTVDPLIKQARRVLRPYEPGEVRALLGAMVQGAAELPLPKRRSNPGKTALRTIAVAALLVVLGTAVYFSTAVHPLFWGATHGRLRIEVAVPVLDGGRDRRNPGLTLYLDDGAEIPLVAAPVLYRLPFTKEESLRIYSTRPLFLPARGYRLKVQQGADLYWGSLLLPAVRDNNAPRGLASTIKRISLPETPGRPLDVELDVRDALSDEVLDSRAVLLVETSQGMIPLRRSEQITSGRVWRFEVRAAGYISQAYALLIRPEETRLFFEARLLPVPAQLAVRGLQPGTRVTINGSSRVESYRPVGPPEKGRYTLVPLDLTGLKDESILFLPPGNLRLNVSAKGQSESLELNLRSGRRIDVRIESNGDALRILLQ